LAHVADLAGLWFVCVPARSWRAHVLDQPLTQWADGIGTNGKLLSEVDDTSIIRARCPIADALDQVATHANKGSLNGLSRSDFVRWHHTDVAQRRKK